jgi:hypothetical protein
VAVHRLAANDSTTASSISAQLYIPDPCGYHDP